MRECRRRLSNRKKELPDIALGATSPYSPIERSTTRLHQCPPGPQSGRAFPYVPVGSGRATGAEILMCFERTKLCDERLPDNYRREVRERVWRRINESRRHFDAKRQFVVASMHRAN